MSTDQFRQLVSEVSGKTSALSLYLFGDPLMHPELDELCRIAWEGCLNTHVSSNFRFKLSDERIRNMVESGMTHLTVCVDGLQQDTYELTRVGGDIGLVLNNLERLLSIKRQLGRKFPKVEVQYIKFQHNVGDVDNARQRLLAMGIDQFTEMWGFLANYSDDSAGKHSIRQPRPNKRLPQCHWPHFMMTMNHDGAVIPCCNYRVSLLYTHSDDKRIIGNAFKSSIWDVWNSQEYQRIRRLVSNPQRANAEPELAKTFCDGCGDVYELEVERNLYSAEHYQWQDVYELRDKKRIVRRPETEVNHFARATWQGSKE